MQSSSSLSEEGEGERERPGLYHILSPVMNSIKEGGEEQEEGKRDFKRATGHPDSNIGEQQPGRNSKDNETRRINCKNTKWNI